MKLLFLSGASLIALSLSACTTLSSPKHLLEAHNNLNQCQKLPASQQCLQGIQRSLYFQARAPITEETLNEVTTLLDTLYNGQQADELFLSRVHDINNRADFFACNHRYFQNTSVPVRWFKASEHISRRCLLGLGAQGCGSSLTFTIAKNTTNPKLYEWRQVVGDNILQQSFPHFKTLFNSADMVDSVEKLPQHPRDNTQKAMQWDFKQLTREQNITQKHHHDYLTKDEAFTRVAKLISGVDLLDTDSRIDYGYTLLGYEDESTKK